MADHELWRDEREQRHRIMDRDGRGSAASGIRYALRQRRRRGDEEADYNAAWTSSATPAIAGAARAATSAPTSGSPRRSTTA